MKIDEFEEVQKKQNYRHLGLFNRSGECIIKYNTVKMKPETRLKQIKTRLESPTLTDSVYIIKCKSYHTKDTKTDDYIINKNNSDVLNEMPIITPPEQFKEVEGYSFSKALELEVKLKAAELENEAQKNKIKTLEDNLSECYNTIDELEENEENLSENNNTAPNWQTFISESLATISPIIDKHLELKERAILLQENKTPTVKTQAPAHVNHNNGSKQVIKDLNDNIINYINSEQDQEMQKKLIDCYENSENFELMIEQLNSINPEMINTITNQMNNAN